MKLYNLFVETMQEIIKEYPPTNAENRQVLDALEEIRKWLQSKSKGVN